MNPSDFSLLLSRRHVVHLLLSALLPSNSGIQLFSAPGRAEERNDATFAISFSCPTRDSRKDTSRAPRLPEHESLARVSSGLPDLLPPRASGEGSEWRRRPEEAPPESENHPPRHTSREISSKPIGKALATVLAQPSGADIQDSLNCQIYCREEWERYARRFTG